MVGRHWQAHKRMIIDRLTIIAPPQQQPQTPTGRINWRLNDLRRDTIYMQFK